ncbi:MAG: M66 family metalloprotease [Aeromonas sp.]
MRIKPLSVLIAAAVIGTPLAAMTAATLYFNQTPAHNDLTGALSARVQFAQSQILPAFAKAGDPQPTLASLRKTLLLVQPVDVKSKQPLAVVVSDREGVELGRLQLKAPADLPKTVYHIPNVPEGVLDFSALPGSSASIYSGSDLAKLDDTQALFLAEMLADNTKVEISTADGRWVRRIYLPTGAEFADKVIEISSQAGYSSTLYYSGREAKLSRGASYRFKHINGQWLYEGESFNNQLEYAPNTWSAELPAEWIKPGLRFEFSQGSKHGELSGVAVGAPTELLLNTIDVGMLTAPRDRFSFATDATSHREYFQTVPLSRMVVNQYETVHFTEVMLPNGTLLTDFDPSEGGWHGGTMRQRIGKELLSHGIDNANYGVYSTAGEGEGGHPFVVAQFTAHNSRGKYANGVVTHGGSGGGGIVTLDNSLGNEFSHEVGHNYGLGHYMGGFKGSVHRAADQPNSTWGWDSDKNLFLPNFSPERSFNDSCVEGECQSPFAGRSFGYDAMAGGSPFSSANRFTMYTPYSAQRIQEFLANKAVFDASSPTGFSRWNAELGLMEPHAHEVEIVTQGKVPTNDASEAKFTELFAQYPMLRLAMSDGAWSKFITLPAASAANQGRILNIEHNAGYNSHLRVNGEEILVARGFKQSFTSDGMQWLRGELVGTRAMRKPEQFGVAVTTLVGYYDPQGLLPSYIYPALHGAYGFTYADDSASLVADSCQLQVESADGIQRFKLGKARINSNVMNKFHVNVASASQPRLASVYCAGDLRARLEIQPAQGELHYSVNGQPLVSAPTPEEPENLPPSVSLPDALSVMGGEAVSLTAQALDPEGDHLTFAWTAPANWLISGGASHQVTLQTPVVSAAQEHTVSVTVSDGQHERQAQIVVSLLPVSGGDSEGCQVTDPNASQVVAWDSAQVYNGGERVSHNQLVWAANYWTQGNQPSRQAGEWTLVSDVDLGWEAGVVFNGGEQTNHGGRRWQAKWWTQGEEPGVADVWQEVGVATCQ